MIGDNSEKIAELDNNGLPTKNFELAALQLRELDNHPALLMWAIGNELISRTSSSADSPTTKYVNHMIAYVKQRSRVPVTHALVDYPKYYPAMVATLNVDVFSVNVYRGNDLTTLWTEMKAVHHSTEHTILRSPTHHYHHCQMVNIG